MTDIEAQPVLSLAEAPLPTSKTLARRKSVPLQFVRFVAFSLRIMRMVLHGKH